MKNKKAKNLEEISKEIIQLKFKKSMTLSQVMNKFYSIMRKHGVKKGTKSSNGAVRMSNFEWSICWCLFQKQIESYFVFDEMLNFPKDLYHY